MTLKLGIISLWGKQSSVLLLFRCSVFLIISWHACGRIFFYCSLQYTTLRRYKKKKNIFLIFFLLFFSWCYSFWSLYFLAFILKTKQLDIIEMQYKPETEKVAMMGNAYIPVLRPLLLTEDPQVQRTRQILMIILGVCLVSIIICSS